jgi:hypothetical protein
VLCETVESKLARFARVVFVTAAVGWVLELVP